MFLSRIKLDTSKRKTMRALASPNLFHGAVASGQKDVRDRVLWRIDPLGGKYYLLVLSKREMAFEGIVDQFGYEEAEPAFETKDYAPLLSRIRNGSEWRFRLVANPTHSRPKEGGGRGKVYAHMTEIHQRRWMMEQAEKNGFSLSENQFGVYGKNWYQFRKKEGSGIKVSMLAVAYEGLLQITDSELFKNALCCGIGREKAYGMGLLTVVSVKS